MSGVHARLSASSAHRWLKCPPSANFKDDKGSVYAAAGTFAHDIAAKCLTTGASPMDFLLHKGKVDGFDVECDMEMVDAIQQYVDYIERDRQPGDLWWVEMPLLNALQKIDKDLGGTADYVRYRPSTKQLLGVDFKFGSGTFVDVDDNEQLKTYGLGAMLEVNAPVEEVEVAVCQPRFEGAKPIRSWIFPAYEILDFIADLQDAAAKSREEGVPRAAGDWCKFCPAARPGPGQPDGCPKLVEKQHALLSADFAIVPGIPPERVAAALALVPFIKEKIKALEEYAYGEALKGTEFPGWKLVDKVPRRQWKDEEEVKKFGMHAGVDVWSDPMLLSPAQVEKKLEAAAPKGKKKDAGKVLEPLYQKISSGTALVPVADARAPVKQITAADFEVAPASTSAVAALF